MQPSDGFTAIAHIGPWIVSVVAIIAWGFKSRLGQGQASADCRRTELLETIAATLDGKA